MLHIYIYIKEEYNEWIEAYTIMYYAKREMKYNYYSNIVFKLI